MNFYPTLILSQSIELATQADLVMHAISTMNYFFASFSNLVYLSMESYSIECQYNILESKINILQMLDHPFAERCLDNQMKAREAGNLIVQKIRSIEQVSNVPHELRFPRQWFEN